MAPRAVGLKEETDVAESRGGWEEEEEEERDLRVRVDEGRRRRRRRREI